MRALMRALSAFFRRIFRPPARAAVLMAGDARALAGNSLEAAWR